MHKNLNAAGFSRWSTKKRLLIMLKLSVILIFLNIATVFAKDGTAQKVTLRGDNITLLRAMKSIKKQTGVSYFLKGKDLANIRKDVDIQNQTLDKAMDKLVSDLPADWMLENGTIVLKPSLKNNYFPKLKPVVKKQEFPDRIITGKVTDQTGNPLEGVSVIVKGTNKGTTTGTDGSYSLTVSENDNVIEFTMVGYNAINQPIGNRGNTINVVMQGEIGGLEEVVVTGYTAQSVKSIVGAVEVVKVADLVAQPEASAISSLQGKASGVQIVGDDSPGSTPQIRIRGFSTLNDNEPLYIIDGVPYQGKLSWLDGNDIENMQILKDAAASSIYGARANNGVVIIDTKKGSRSGKTMFSVDSYIGMSAPARDAFPKYLNPTEFAKFLYLSYDNFNVGDDPNLRPGQISTTGLMYGSDPINPVLPEYILAGTKIGTQVTEADVNPDLYNYSRDPATFYQITKANQAGTDWMRAMTRDAIEQNYHFSLRGGDDNSRFYLGGGYLNQDGIMKYTGFTRYNVRANSEFSLFNRVLQIGENISYEHNVNQGVSTNLDVASGGGDGTALSGAYRAENIMPVYDIMGNLAGNRGGGVSNANNPFATLYRQKDNLGIGDRVFGNIYANLKVLQVINLRSSFGLSYNNLTSNEIVYPNPENQEGSVTNNSFSESRTNRLGWTWTNTATFHKNWNDKHDLNLLLGTEAIKNKNRSLSGSGNDFFILGDLNYYYLSNASSNLGTTSSGDIRMLYSLFGKADYSYGNRYYASLTLRRDGSSNFGPKNKFAYFPAAGIGWVISEEKFFNPNWISSLKLRAGYGETGNQSIPSFQYLSQFENGFVSSGYPISGNNVQSGLWVRSYENEDIRWEKVKSVNLGIDFGLFNNSVIGSVDVYNKKTVDILFPVPLPSHVVGGGGAPFQNVGSMRNKGIEIGLGYIYNSGRIDGFHFGVNGTFSRNKNEILELAPDVTNQIYGTFRALNTSILMKGQEYGSFYGYKQVGIYSEEDITHTDVAKYSNARIGGPKFADLSGPDGVPDGKIDEFDRTIIGTPLPKFTYSLNFDLSYGQFDSKIFFYGSYGNDIFDATRYYTDLQGFEGIASTRVMNYWTPSKPTMVPTPYRNRPSFELLSNSYYVQSGSYFRLRNLQIGYNLKFTQKMLQTIKSARIYISGSNLFTITPYSGVTPEIIKMGTGEQYDSQGVDIGVYPTSRKYIFGIQLNF